MNGFNPIGTIAPVHSRDVRRSSWGLGFEKLDRDVFDPEKAYDRVAELGVKWIRIQSGWARTEASEGVYDFAWLDSIVDNLLLRGLQPWMCLCYGNGIYDEAAAKVFGAVGCPRSIPKNSGRHGTITSSPPSPATAAASPGSRSGTNPTASGAGSTARTAPNTANSSKPPPPPSAKRIRRRKSSAASSACTTTSV